MSLLALFVLLLLSLHESPSSAKRCHPDDERALLQIKSHFNNAPAFSTWTPATACCRKWRMVACKRLHFSGDYRVNFLDITAEEGIHGHIPAAVGDLPYLETLIFRLLPNLTGPIPATLGQLRSLQLLVLGWNDLTGPIPESLSDLTNLSSISLNNNRLTGPVPGFLSWIPAITGISLEHNQLSGPIPEDFRFLQNGAALQLSHNRISGRIPRSLGDVKFSILEVGSNRLTGDASFLFGKGKKYNHLDLSRNRLSFDLGKTQLDVSPGFFEFDISHNLIYGFLPAWISKMTRMTRFNVSYNLLCGHIPGELKGQAASSFAHNRCLCGAPLGACRHHPH